MKTSLRKLTNALMLVMLGAAAYLSLPTARRLMTDDDSARPQLEELDDGSLAKVQVEGAVEGAGEDSAGNIVLANCLVALERRASLRVDVLQSGAIDGRYVETSGAYLQKGQGDQRRFSLLLQGRIGSATSRLWQVGDGRYLFTDLAWDGGQPAGQSPLETTPAPGRRKVSRVDLSLIRRRIESAGDRANPLAPGRATAEVLRPGAWAAQGGLPMLIGSLSENFNFATPRQMSLRNEPVYALIGAWKQKQLDNLLTPARPPQDTSDKPLEPVPMPDRMPHHVLVAIGARDLFPRLVEYRSKGDPLSAPGLATDARFRESERPLLRMDLLRPRFDEPIDDEYFVYRAPEGVNVDERTGERQRLAEKRTGMGESTLRN